MLIAVRMRSMTTVDRYFFALVESDLLSTLLYKQVYIKSYEVYLKH